MKFMGYSMEDWITLTCRGLIMWVFIIPAFALFRWGFPNLHIGIQMAIGFFMAIIVSVGVNNMTKNIDFGGKIKGSYDKFLNNLNKKMWGETNDSKKN